MLRVVWCTNLVAPYCAIPRDYLSNAPLLRAMGFLVSQHGQLGAIPPPGLLWVFLSWRALEVEARYPPTKSVSQRYCAIPYENKANGCDTPLCDTISKGYYAIGGVSCIGPLSVQNEIPAISRKFGAICDKFAQRPPRERPLLGISDSGEPKPKFLRWFTSA